MQIFCCGSKNFGLPQECPNFMVKQWSHSNHHPKLSEFVPGKWEMKTPFHKSHLLSVPGKDTSLSKYIYIYMICTTSTCHLSLSCSHHLWRSCSSASTEHNLGNNVQISKYLRYTYWSMIESLSSMFIYITLNIWWQKWTHIPAANRGAETW